MNKRFYNHVVESMWWTQHHINYMIVLPFEWLCLITFQHPPNTSYSRNGALQQPLFICPTYGLQASPSR